MSDGRVILRRRLIVNFGGLRVHGYLTVSPGQLVLAATGLAGLLPGIKQVVQTTAEVTHVKTIITLPWMRSHLIVRGDTDIGVAMTSLDKELRAAINEAGFKIKENRAWFSIGGEAIKHP
jgi:hypothetical protein